MSGKNNEDISPFTIHTKSADTPIPSPSTQRVDMLPDMVQTSVPALPAFTMLYTPNRPAQPNDKPVPRVSTPKHSVHTSANAVLSDVAVDTMATSTRTEPITSNLSADPITGLRTDHTNFEDVRHPSWSRDTPDKSTHTSDTLESQVENDIFDINSEIFLAINQQYVELDKIRNSLDNGS